MMKNIEMELNNIIEEEAIKTLFQPIFNFHNGEIIGYEALSRGPIDSNLFSPLDLLEAAKAYNKIFELEMVFRKKAIESAKDIKKDKMLFFNVEPDIINDKHFEKGQTSELLNKHNLDLDIVFEITERTAIEDYDKYKKVIENYKKQGYRIAIDDVGSGYSGLQRINMTKPQFIKIDMEIIRDIHIDSFKQSLIKAIVTFSTATGIKTIAEGIETKEELKTLIKLGVYAGQGFFLSRPSSEIIQTCNHIKTMILDINYEKEKFSAYDIYTNKIGTIAETNISTHKNVNCSEIKEIFEESKYEGLCIINESNHVEGLIMKNYLDSILATQYGYSVYSRRPVSLIMDKTPIVVDYNLSTKKVSELITLRDNEKVYDNIIVIKDNKYYGMVSIRKLLQHLINLETDYARHINPLTLLPGNKIINSMLSQCCRTKKKVTLCYVDLDNFKVYNDIYGFENGDKVIKLTARILENIMAKYYPLDSFIGHIGGDDFVFMITEDIHNIDEICRNIIDEFDKNILKCFNKNHITTGKIIALDRENKQKVYGLTSISIGGFIGSLTNFESLNNVGEYMSVLKKKAKEIKESSYYIINQSNIMKSSQMPR